MREKHDQRSKKRSDSFWLTELFPILSGLVGGPPLPEGFAHLLNSFRFLHRKIFFFTRIDCQLVEFRPGALVGESDQFPIALTTLGFICAAEVAVELTARFNPAIKGTMSNRLYINGFVC